MSVVGPRPALWNQDVLISERDKYHANNVKPGLTGLAQINGRDKLEIPDKAKLDGIWSDLKKSGVRGFPHGDAALAFEKMNSILKENGIYVVPVGELESFIPTVGGHGPNWVNSVLETYPDLENSIYNEIKSFVY